jgi:hypothetical protein
MYPNFLNCRNYRTMENRTAAMVMMIISGHPHIKPLYALSTFIKASIGDLSFCVVYPSENSTPLRTKKLCCSN